MANFSHPRNWPVISTQGDFSDIFHSQSAVLLRMSIVYRECGGPISVVILESPLVFFLANFSQEYIRNNLLGALRRSTIILQDVLELE